MDGQVLNISPLVIWVVALSQLLSFALSIYQLLGSGARVNKQQLDDHKATLDNHTLRLASVEQTLAGHPTQTDYGNLMLALEAMKGEMAVLRTQMKGVSDIMQRVEAMVARHENHLLDGKIR
jgi:hypothetical protein